MEFINEFIIGFGIAAFSYAAGYIMGNMFPIKKFQPHDEAPKVITNEENGKYKKCEHSGKDNTCKLGMCIHLYDDSIMC